MKRNQVIFRNTIRQPFQQFFKVEASGGILLLVFTFIALLWANSPLSELYSTLWQEKLSVSLGSFEFEKPLLLWINDGLMAIFFFVVGLEIKRELIAGELSSFRQASLPVSAALGGMLFPAIIFLTLNHGQRGIEGWGIPMATDIAFSLGVLSLLGRRVPLSLKIFLVAFAIVDDLGAVLVIAVFYSEQIHWGMLFLALGLYAILILANRLNFRQINFYTITGVIIWYLFLKSGIHSTLAGVLIAFSIPANRQLNIPGFIKRVQYNLNEFKKDTRSGELTLTEGQMNAIENLETDIYKIQSPLQRLEQSLHGFVTYFVMPLFALTNAGVVFSGSLESQFFNPLTLNIEISLLLGKVLGIFTFTWLSVKLGISTLPSNLKWIHVLGIGFIGGMGFTMSLFISNLAYVDQLLINQAKAGILTGSLIAAIVGYFFLKRALSRAPANK